MPALVSALVLAIVFLRGWKPAIVLAVLFIAAYFADLIDYPLLAPLVGAAGAGLLLAYGVAPAIGNALLLLFCCANYGLVRILENGTWTVIDVAKLICEVNLAVGGGLLIALGASALLKRSHLNWFHITYAPIVASASIPSALLLSNGSSRVAPQIWLAGGAMVLIPFGAHVVALKLRSQTTRIGAWPRRKSASTSKFDLPCPIELRRQLTRLEWAARARSKPASSLRTTTRRNDDRNGLQRNPSASVSRIPSGELVRIRESLKEYHARYTTLIETAPHAIILADADGKVLLANRATKRILGFSSSLVGKSIEQLIPPGSRTPHPFDLNLVVKAPDEIVSIHREAEILCRDGKPLRTMIYVDEVRGSGGCKYAIQILPTNEIARAAKLLKQARAAARVSRQARVETLAAMSHELRTPLHGLIATLDMLRDERLSKDGAHNLAVAKTSARSLLKLVNDVLDLARMEGSKFPLNSEHFNLGSLVFETIDEFAAKASAEGLELRRKIEGTLSPSYIGDRQRVKQILANLISNAIKFTSYGSVTVRIKQIDKTIVIDVTDTGPGIPLERSASIFEPFVQLKTGPVRIGSGLGLPISRQLCRAMGGDLVLLNTSSSGSTFRATLMLEASNDIVPEERSNRVYMNPAGKILIVEDHEINQYVVKAMLDSLGCSVRIASDGNEALSALRDERFDLVLMDCRMPGLDGYEATRRAKGTLRIGTPIIAITANASQEERAECMEAGMDDFLAKPFGRAELSRILCKWLDPRMQKSLPGLAGPVELDEAVFDELWKNFNWRDSAMRTICESFMQTIDSCARSVLASRNEDLSRQLHTLIGTSGTIGAREVTRIASKMQESFKAGRSEELLGLVTSLRAAGKSFRTAFYGRLQDKLGHVRGGDER